MSLHIIQICNRTGFVYCVYTSEVCFSNYSPPLDVIHGHPATEPCSNTPTVLSGSRVKSQRGWGSVHQGDEGNPACDVVHQDGTPFRYWLPAALLLNVTASDETSVTLRISLFILWAVISFLTFVVFSQTGCTPWAEKARFHSWTRKVSRDTNYEHERWTEASNPLLVEFSGLVKEMLEGQGRERGIRGQRDRWTETWFTPI